MKIEAHVSEIEKTELRSKLRIYLKKYTLIDEYGNFIFNHESTINLLVIHRRHKFWDWDYIPDAENVYSIGNTL